MASNSPSATQPSNRPPVCIHLPAELRRRHWRIYGMIILAPLPPTPKPTPVVPVVVGDRFDRKLLAAVEGHGDESAPVWGIVHQIVADEHPPSRAHRRQLVARLLCRVRGLLRAGRIVRDGQTHVRLREPEKPSAPAPSKPVKNLPPAPYPTVGDLGTFYPGGPSRRVFKV